MQDFNYVNQETKIPLMISNLLHFYVYKNTDCFL